MAVLRLHEQHQPHLVILDWIIPALDVLHRQKLCNTFSEATRDIALFSGS